MQLKKQLFLLTFVTPFLVSCSNEMTAEKEVMPIAKLTYIGETIISNQAMFAHTPIGGLSGIDYDPTTNKWLVISDDRVNHGPARAYIGSLALSENKVGSFKFDQLITLKQPDGTPYPSENQYKKYFTGIVPDFESVRFTPGGNGIRYTSEGDRDLQFNPFIRTANLEGDYQGMLTVPSAYQYTAADKNSGFYNNLAFEGSSFTPDGQYYFVSMEAPLKQDGLVPSITKGGDVRVLKFDKQGHVITQYVYSVDALPAAPGMGKHADNGVSEMLAIDNEHLLMLERAGIQDAQGHYHNYIRIYQTDLSHATNVNGQNKLVAGTYQPMHKKLLLSLNDLNLPLLDNVEGISFGPRLANGQRTLVVISDNNFNKHEITQIIAFSVKFNQ